MKTMTFDEACARSTEVLDSVVGDREVVVTRDGHKPVVIVARRSTSASKETVHLTSSPANARRPFEAMERA